MSPLAIFQGWLLWLLVFSSLVASWLLVGSTINYSIIIIISQTTSVEKQEATSVIQYQRFEYGNTMSTIADEHAMNRYDRPRQCNQLEATRMLNSSTNGGTHVNSLTTRMIICRVVGRHLKDTTIILV